MYSVVLIDDEPWTLEGMMNTFKWQENGFEVVCKESNPLKAYEFIKNNSPDVIFTDIRMPGINGIELITKLHQEGIESIIIIVSGFAEFEYAQSAIKQGAFDYCLKPISEEDSYKILDKVKLHLDKLNCTENEDTSTIKYSGNNYEFKKILEYIQNNYNKKLRLKDISEDLFINPSYASQLFKKELNISFTDYINNLRMEKAKILINDISLSINNIGELIGIEDYFYFNKVFKKHFGITPHQYRSRM